MVFRAQTTGTGRGRGPWPVLVLLILIVVVPAACVLWFMAEAMENERLAVRQKLSDVHHGQLTLTRQQLRAVWERRIRALRSLKPGPPGARTFAAIVRAGLADSAVVVGQDGAPLYPAPVHAAGTDTKPRSEAWQRARALEHSEGDARAAATAYADIARAANDPNHAGRARLAEARCHVKAGDREAALALLTVELAKDEYALARTETGRLLQPDALLRGAELLGGGDPDRGGRILDRLFRRLQNYRGGDLPSGQRRFLMRALTALAPDRADFPTLDAEALAAAYLESHGELSGRAFGSLLSMRVSWFAEHEKESGSFLRPCRLGQVWELSLPEEGIVALYRNATILAALGSMEDRPGRPPEAEIRLLPPGTPYEPSAGAVTLPADRPLAGWQLVFEPGGPDPLAKSAEGRRALYLWMGLLFLVSILALSALMARLVGRQLKLTRLKNDLVATVTHELKTPLASIRVLVDTLLDGRASDPNTTREYLELIARENARLGRLIENFLTFSRMERGKRSFDLTPVDPARIARDAVEAVREKFEAAGFRLEVEIAADLPEILADADAMETVLLNLLDNAYKYSKEDRRVAVRVFERGVEVCFEVEDHGIGMTARAARKVFDRFYQADRRLSREVGGCGLGLSIVKFVADAHHGRIEVESRPGDGSRFTVRLPVAEGGAAEPPG